MRNKIKKIFEYSMNYDKCLRILARLLKSSEAAAKVPGELNKLTDEKKIENSLKFFCPVIPRPEERAKTREG